MADLTANPDPNAAADDGPVLTVAEMKITDIMRAFNVDEMEAGFMRAMARGTIGPKGDVIVVEKKGKKRRKG